MRALRLSFGSFFVRSYSSRASNTSWFLRMRRLARSRGSFDDIFDHLLDRFDVGDVLGQDRGDELREPVLVEPEPLGFRFGDNDRGCCPLVPVLEHVEIARTHL